MSAHLPLRAMPLPLTEDRRAELKVAAIEAEIETLVVQMRIDQMSLRTLRDDLKDAKAEWRAAIPNRKRRKVFLEIC